MNIECSCDYDAGYDYMWEWYRKTYRKARKPHICCECGETIPVGAVYEYAVGFCREPEGKGLEDSATCATCCRIREDLAPSCPAGMLREHLSECLGFDYVTNESQFDDDQGDGAGEEA